MNYLSLDLEGNQPSEKIIQIGACIANIGSGEVFSKFSQLVLIDEAITPYIETLTGISNLDMHAEGVSLKEAYGRLIAWRQAFIDAGNTLELNPLVWGGGDSLWLRNQLGADATPWFFGRRWIDVKTIYQFRQLARGEKIQAGLAKALIRCGLKFEGRKHNALDDAVNTARVAHVLLSEMRGTHGNY